MAHLLQCLAEYDEIEAAVGVISESAFEVALVDGYAARDCALNFCSFNLYAARVDVFVFAEPGEQFTFAASEIENAGCRANQLGDHGVVSTREHVPVYFGSGLRGHRERS